MIAAPLTRSTVAELGPNQTILPADLKQKALVQQWMFFADQEVSQTYRRPLAFLVCLSGRD